MSTYVIGDLHGCFDEWISFKNKIEASDTDAQFILVGDIIDRGPKKRELLSWCKHNIRLNGKYQMVMGNHEYARQNSWNIKESDIIFYSRLPYYIEKYINDKRFIIVHADLPKSVVKDDFSLKKNEEISQSEAHEMVWNRSLDPFDLIPGAILVHGHNPTVFEDSFRTGDYSDEKLGRVYNLGNRYNIDCGLAYDELPGHRLAALRLEDLEVIYNDDM